MTSITGTALEFYAANGAALFPMPAGSKVPTGIVDSFAHDCSSDPAAWATWAAANPGCNWGVVAGPSGWIIADIDTVELGRDAAWKAWCELCAHWGIDPPAPHVQSARGGWHVYFAVPPGVDARALRQPDAVKKLINVRAGNGYVVAAGSYYDGTTKGEASGPYVLLSNNAPYPAPDALVAHCTRAAAAPAPNLGTRDQGDVAIMIRWLAERDQFSAYEDWIGAGMALKIEFGDDGRETWRLTHDETVTPEVEEAKWQSFATEPRPGVQTIASWLKRASDLGYRGSVRTSASAMFGNTVAEIAAKAGASLPPPPGGSAAAGALPMIGREAAQDAKARELADEFLTTVADVPDRPVALDCPTLSDSFADRVSFSVLRRSIDRVFAMAETPKAWRQQRVHHVLAALAIVDRNTFDTVCRRVLAFGVPLNVEKVKSIALGLEAEVQRGFIRHDDFHYDAKGKPESDNSDNVAIFLNRCSIEIRWNAWLNRAEILGGIGDYRWPEWSYLDDAAFAAIRSMGNRTGTRFTPAKEFLWDSLISIARLNEYDPARDHLARLQAAWDGTPRLAIWLSATCGVPCDPYHQSVGKTIVGGLVKRIRHPGCKHDTMPVFFGPQGTGKSTIAAILADMGQTPLSLIVKGEGKWFSDTVRLGDEAKELILSLAGKSVVEIAEMGTRNTASANHIKAMISRQVDEGRAAYDRATSKRARRNIFIGTANEDEPLQDPTGNRRFLPVRVDREINLAWLCENVGQIIGEAAALEARDDDFNLPRSIWAIAAEHQEAARSTSDMETLLQDFFAPTDAAGAVTWISASDLIELSRLAGWRAGSSNATRSSVMKQMKFREEMVLFHGKRQRIWVRGAAPGFRPSDIVKEGTRYTVGADNNGRVQVRMTRESASPGPMPVPPAPPAR